MGVDVFDIIAAAVNAEVFGGKFNNFVVAIGGGLVFSCPNGAKFKIAEGCGVVVIKINSYAGIAPLVADIDIISC